MVDHLAEVIELSKPSARITDRTMARNIQKYVEVGKDVLMEAVEKVVAVNANEGVMVKVYGSDGTPLLTNKGWIRRHGGLVVRRRGHASQEWLIQRVFVQGRDLQGERIRSIYFPDPAPLTHGKTAHALAACAWQCCPSLRSLGHKGAALTVYTFDRGYLSSLSRLLQQYHMEEAHSSIDADHTLDALLDFVVSIGDPLHDVANGISWGLRPYLKPDVLKDIFVAVQSVRNAYDLIMQKLPLWLPQGCSFSGS